MSGEESLGSVESRAGTSKSQNLMLAELVIFVSRSCFTSDGQHLSSMLSPDGERQRYFNNLISGLAMNMYGPPHRLLFSGIGGGGS